MALNATNLLIQMAQLPATFTGSPQELAAAMVRRMRIVSPSGSNFFVTGSVEPTSNVGPWLKNGTQWFVWSESLKRYVPLDISASFTAAFWEQASTPSSSNPNVWLRTTKDPTDIDPSRGSPIGWYEFDGTNWVPFNSIPQNGPSSGRPASPVDYQQYFDTSINCLIHWERAAWRTVSGSPGDLKYVAYGNLANALVANPGWNLFGASNQNERGRIIMQAAANDDGSNPLTVNPNLAVRRAGEVFGETDFVAINDSTFDSADASPAITVTQSTTTLTANHSVFAATMIGQQIIFANGSPTVTITAYTSPTVVTVSISQSVLATTFQIPGSTVPYPPQIAQWCLVKE